MIGQLRGTLMDKRPNQVVVDVGGVGYQVNIPLSTFYGLGELHGNVTLLVHTLGELRSLGERTFPEIHLMSEATAVTSRGLNASRP